MNRLLVLGLTAAMAASVGSAIAQDKEKGGAQMPGASGAQPQMQGTPGSQPGQKSQGSAQQEPKGRSEQQEPKGRSEKGAASGTQPPSKGAAQTEPKEGTKGTAQKGAEPREKSTKGTAEKAEPKGQPQKGAKGAEPTDKSKGTAEKTEPKGQPQKGAAEKGTEQKGATPKGTAQQKGPGERVQISQQQRSEVGQALAKDTRINRVNNVNVSINVGTRVPRSVRLAALPASVVAIVPAYRSYHYFVVNEQLCIVDPATYEIVDVIVITERTAGAEPRGSARLVLTEEEREFILSEVDMSGDSTLALGALSEGADVPRDARLRTFSDTIVQRVPKVRGYKFLTTENRLAIVDPQGAKVQLVIEGRRR